MPKIDITKSYMTRDGRPVRIFATDRADASGYTVVGVIMCDGQEELSEWQADGSYFKHNENGEVAKDLVEMPPYGTFKIDDPIMVRYANDNKWYRRYFAGVDLNGYPIVWANGTTSWTSGGYTNSWPVGRHPTLAEMANGEYDPGDGDD